MTDSKANGSVITWQIVSHIAAVAMIVGTLTWYLGGRLTVVESTMDDYTAFRDAGGRYTIHQGRQLERRVQELETQVKDLPPDWFREQVRELREEVRRLNEKSGP